MKLKSQVESILAEFPKTRDSDITLMIHLWNRYYPAHLHQAPRGQGIYLSSLYTLPTQESIKRERAFIQNEEFRFLPTDEKVRRARRIKEETYRAYINNLSAFKRI